MNTNVVYIFYLSSAENRGVDTLLMLLDSMNSIKKKLLKNETTMNDVRALSDALMEEFPASCTHPVSVAAIKQPVV